MIPANHPYEARFRHTHKRADGTTCEHFTTKPVIAWVSNGHPVVVGEKQLVRADSFDNFVDVVEGRAPIVAAVPGGGWVAEYKQDDGSTFTSPVVAWVFDSKGDGTPIGTDSDAIVDTVVLGNFNGLYDPEHRPQQITDTEDES